MKNTISLCRKFPYGTRRQANYRLSLSSRLSSRQLYSVHSLPREFPTLLAIYNMEIQTWRLETTMNVELEKAIRVCPAFKQAIVIQNFSRIAESWNGDQMTIGWFDFDREKVDNVSRPALQQYRTLQGVKSWHRFRSHPGYYEYENEALKATEGCIAE